METLTDYQKKIVWSAFANRILGRADDFMSLCDDDESTDEQITDNFLELLIEMQTVEKLMKV